MTQKQKLSLESKNFESFLNKIGGLESGYRKEPDAYYYPVGSRLFKIFKSMGVSEDKNPFRYRIYDRTVASVGDGWLKLVQKCIEELIASGWNKEILQIKEKFGGLRFYANGADDAIISRYEQLSYTICEECGSTDNVTTESSPRWIRTLCIDCKYKTKPM